MPEVSIASAFRDAANGSFAPTYHISTLTPPGNSVPKFGSLEGACVPEPGSRESADSHPDPAQPLQLPLRDVRHLEEYRCARDERRGSRTARLQHRAAGSR